MRTRTARSSWLSTLSALVLTTVTGCASGPPEVVTKVQTVEIQVPVLVPIPPEYLSPCYVHYLYPKVGLPVRSLIERLAATEDALAVCSNQIENIIAVQAKAAKEIEPPQ